MVRSNTCEHFLDKIFWNSRRTYYYLDHNSCQYETLPSHSCQRLQCQLFPGSPCHFRTSFAGKRHVQSHYSRSCYTTSTLRRARPCPSEADSEPKTQLEHYCGRPYVKDNRPSISSQVEPRAHDIRTSSQTNLPVPNRDSQYKKRLECITKDNRCAVSREYKFS